jgi:lactate permease
VALSIAPAVLLSGQTAGGNIGNALSPAVSAVGTAAAGASGREGEVLRRNLGASALLLLSVLVALVVQVWVLA